MIYFEKEGKNFLMTDFNKNNKTEIRFSPNLEKIKIGKTPWRKATKTERKKFKKLYNEG